MAFHWYSAYLVISRNGDIEENRWNGQKIEKNDFPYFGVLGHQKNLYLGRKLKKSLQGSIHVQFYTAIKDPFGRFLLQLGTVSIQRHKNKFPTLRSCGILVTASPDRRLRKRAQTSSNLRLWCGRLKLTAVTATVHTDTFIKLVMEISNIFLYQYLLMLFFYIDAPVPHYSLGIRRMRSKWGKKLQNAKWAGKSLSAENVWEWCPKQHIKTPAPHLELLWRF